MSKESIAITRLEDAVKVSRPRGKTELELTYRIAGTDEEIVRVARESLDAEMSALGFTNDERRRGDSNQFFFSGKTWSAPWNPKGPKPPWSQNPENN
jgi:stress response protein SCP2